MTEITELERRLTAALGRISYNIETMAAPLAIEAEDVSDDSPSEADHLRAELSVQQDANAAQSAELIELRNSLAERDAKITAQVAALKDAEAALQDAADPTTDVAEYKQEIKDLNLAVDVLDGTFTQLKAASDALRENNIALREANAQGLADASLVDAGLRAELEVLVSRRAAEEAEMAALAKALSPLLEDNDDA